MKQLHTSYSNLGSWKSVHDHSSGVVSFQFDQRRGIFSSIFLFLLCILAAIWLSNIRSNAGNDGARVAGVWLLSVTGVAVPLIIITHGVLERRKGDLIRYDMSKDVLSLPRIERTVQEARQRVNFSSEHYAGSEHHSFELNLVLDGERIKFLSSIEGNAFKSIIKSLESLGFSVSHQKIKI